MASWNNLDQSSMQNEGGYMDTSISGPSDDKSNLKRAQNCVPVMICNIKRYGDNLTLYGTPVKIATFLGIVRNIEQLTTKTTFVIEDDTGTVNAVKWLEGETDYVPPVKLNQYARVYGMLRQQSNEIFVMVLKIAPLESLSELMCHLMEVTYVTLQAERGMDDLGKGDSTMIGNSSSNVTSAMISNGMNDNGLSNEQNIVLKVINQHSEDEMGCERGKIKEMVPANMRSRVDDILEFLSSEGHIYTTRTDDYFKTI